MDILTPEKRSEVMSRIRAKDTKPELAVRIAAHRLGFRFRLHRKDLPGRPDLVFPRLRKVIFVHGCFWHRHQDCKQAYSPKSNVAFWTEKFTSNVERDRRSVRELEKRGWQSLVIWECETTEQPMLLRRISNYLRNHRKRKQ